MAPSISFRKSIKWSVSIWLRSDEGQMADMDHRMVNLKNQQGTILPLTSPPSLTKVSLSTMAVPWF